MTTKTKEFIMLIRQLCIKANINLLLPKTDKVLYPTGGIEVNGYFDDIHSERPTLAVACGKSIEKWLPTLVHETCHMDQWLENVPVWKKQYSGPQSCDTIMDEWILGKDYPTDVYTYAIRTMQELEIDCEERTVAKIKNLELPIPVSEYIKGANAYLLFYSVILTKRRWYDRAPYDVPAILKSMPHVWLSDYINVPKRFVQQCERYVFKKQKRLQK